MTKLYARITGIINLYAGLSVTKLYASITPVNLYASFTPAIIGDRVFDDTFDYTFE